MGAASELARRLAEEAEAVCRAYLPNGKRSGSYWTCGDVTGARGRSLFVKLSGPTAGKWTDAAVGQHGDLLDLITLNRNFSGLPEALAEARQFLRDPGHIDARLGPQTYEPPRDTRLAASKLFALSRPVPGTLAETYLRGRGITVRLSWPCLRFYPACYYRPDDGEPRQAWPALLGAVTDAAGNLTGLQRTYLARDGSGKAPLADPRRALGRIRGNAVRFGEPADVMAAGEGIETMLSLLSLFPALPMAAGLTAAHLSALVLPPGLRRLYVLRDNDAAGECAEARLAERCRDAGIECRVLVPTAKDLNVDLCTGPVPAVRGRMLAQMEPSDGSRYSA
jgi:hypothetical protein